MTVTREEYPEIHALVALVEKLGQLSVTQRLQGASVDAKVLTCCLKIVTELAVHLHKRHPKLFSEAILAMRDKLLDLGGLMLQGKLP